MSQENVEIVQRAFEIFNRYGETDLSGIVQRAFEIFNRYTAETDLSWDEREKAFDAFAKLATPDFEYVEPPEWPGAGVHRGLRPIPPCLGGGFFEALSQMTAEVEETFDAGDRVVVFCALAGAGHVERRGAGDETRPGVHAPRRQARKAGDLSQSQ